ncbi:hypothetical protein BC332_28742 [Capsicum chinense]|nr:hypothetical protein BC332_28742 [Capsicum chinense]
MGDHAVEFERILDYKDELLRTNPRTSCVVKLGEANEEARHKTIITMLEEIRVKLMTRIGTLREFPNTWNSNYSLMCLKVLEENINRAPSAKPTAPVVATATGSGRGRGRPKKTLIEATNAAPQGKNDGSGRGRGRPKKTLPEAPNAAPQGKNNGSGRGRGRPKKTSSEAITEPPQAKKERGRPKRTISVGATATPLPTTPPVPTIFSASSSAPPDFCTSSSIAKTTKRGMGSGRGNTAPFKRSLIYVDS